MRLPLQIISLHHVPLSQSLKSTIRRKAEQLEACYDRLQSCRIVVDGPVRHHRLGAFNVRIDMSVPGEALVVTHKTREVLSVAIRDAFVAAQRRLLEFVRHYRSPRHVNAAPLLRRVAKSEAQGVNQGA